MEERINTPFTVPEGYFAEAKANALKGARKVRARRRAAFCGIAAAAVAVALVAFLPTASKVSYENYSDELLSQMVEMNELDEFLNLTENQ